MAEGKTIQTIKASELKNANNSSNFTYSMWLYVDDWNYNFGKEKSVLLQYFFFFFFLRLIIKGFC